MSRIPTCHRKLKRYWVELPDAVARNKPYALGIGVTEDSVESALRLIEDDLLAGSPARPLRIIEDIDVSTLDPMRIRPHMGVPAVRGIWYPIR